MPTATHQPRRVLVTGGAGFIGSNLVHRWLANDPTLRIVNLDRMTYAATERNLEGVDPERHQLVVGDICDRALVERLLREHDIDTVVHLAAESHVDRSIDGPAEFVRTNVEGTCALLEATRQVWLAEGRAAALADAGRTVRFHHVSTDEVYGDLEPEDPAFSETTPYAPSSPYSASKAGSDHLVRAWARTFGLPVTISNCSNNYGPRQHAEKLIPTVIRKCLNRQPIPVYGKGSNVRDWLYVDDHADAIWHIVRHGGQAQTYNVGGNNEWSNLDLVHALCRAVAAAVDCPAEELLGLITFVRDRPGHDHRYAIDPRKLEALGWMATRTLDDGLQRTVAHYVALWQAGGLEEPGRLGLGSTSDADAAPSTDDEGVAGCHMLAIRSHLDARGGLAFAEGEADLPFAIARVYYLWDAQPGTIRAEHAHKALRQVYIALHGGCDVVLEDGEASKTVRLERPDQGLYLGPMVWRRLDNFAPNTVLLVLASAGFDEADYFRDKQEFLAAAAARRKA
ncbi:MAG: dTDP-glucose 4,6-dehydratase [Deltaproteobacteria bacterium]|nr:dTDP-glucose 4,6-dehydratase [Deltaproteobacteria bacterium]